MWITYKAEEGVSNLPIFYKKFKAEKTITKCNLKISALGIFNININGHEIKDYFMPGWSNYNKYANLCEYDLTPFLRSENLLAVTLAEGWYSGRLGYTTKPNVYGTGAFLYAEIVLEYSDKSRQIIQTDSSWQVGNSKIICSSFFDGESIDNRLIEGFFNNLPHAITAEKQLPFHKYDYEPVRIVDQITPKVLYYSDNTIVFDFKQNFAGFLTFTALGKRGDEVIIRHAEMLSKTGELYLDNLRSVRATDKIILSGKEDEFKPKFTFHGFRYAQISMPVGTKITDVFGIVLSQDINYGGAFNCSDQTINAIYKNVLWGQKSNFISIPTDCPQRDERLGWTGDAEVFCNSAMFNSDCNKFFANYLKLIRMDVLPDGKVPSFVPFFIPVSVSTAGVPGWADAICVIPYYHYLHYREKKVVEYNLPYAVKHLNYYLENSENYLLRVQNPFGDWLSVERAEDTPAISQCFFGLSALLISKLYAILDDDENCNKYLEIYQKIKCAFRENFLREGGKILGDSQTIYALALSVGFVLAEEIKVAFKESVKRAGDKLTTGFIGVKYLLPALCEIGEVDLAYKIIKQTEYPSWGYTIKMGATTIWERWNGFTKENGFFEPSMNSFNHYSLGSCAEWLYSHVLGIKLSESGQITISPSFSSQLKFASGKYSAFGGKIEVEWKCKQGEFWLTVTSDKLPFTYDFGERKIISIQKTNDKMFVILK